MRIVFLSWRDLSHPQAGGSEVLVDRLARGLMDRGHETALLCGGPVGRRPYPVICTGGTYGQYLRAPGVCLRRFHDADLLVDVENGIPFFSPLWRRKPVVCLVHHVHTDQWSMRFPGVVARVGRMLEERAMPAVYRHAQYLAVSPSTVSALAGIGIERDRINLLTEGVDLPTERVPRSDVPLFVAVGRLVPHKRVDVLLRAWEQVRAVVGGELVVIGDGPERHRLEGLAGAGVRFVGHVGEEEKWRLLQRAWLLVHAAHHEGWGIAVMEAAACGTPAVAFDVPGVRDAVVSGVTGALAQSEAEFEAAWISLVRDGMSRAQLSEAAEQRAHRLSWAAAVDRFIVIAEKAVADGRVPSAVG